MTDKEKKAISLLKESFKLGAELSPYLTQAERERKLQDADKSENATKLIVEFIKLVNKL